MSSRATPSWRADDALVALLLAAFAFAAAAGGWFWRADRLVYDTALAWSPSPVPDEIVIVAIDDASVDAIGRWPWRRSVQATLLERLAAARPRAVALDLVLSEPDPDPRQDALLAAALVRAAPVVMPVLWQALPGEPLRSLEPVEPLRAAVHLGAAEATVDADGVLRHAFLRAGRADRPLEHLALALLHAGGERAHPGLAVERMGAVGDGAGWQRQDRFLVRYIGPPGHLRRVSVVDVLSGAVPPEVFAGRYVLVGMTAQGLGDTLATPVNAGQRAMPGVEVLGHTLHTLRHGTAPRPLPPWVEGVTAALAAAALVAVFILAGTRVALLAALASVPLALAVSGVLLLLGLWWGPAAFTVAAGLAYPLWSWRRLERGVALLDREIGRLAAEPGLLSAVASAAPSRDRLAARLAALHTAADTLRAARRFLADALAGLPTAMLVDDGGGRVLLANPPAARLFEVDGAQELQGLDLARLLGEFECVPAVDWPAALAGARRMVQGVMASGRLPDGSDHLLQVRAVAMHGGTRLIATITDVTPIRDAERAREELLAFVSHDLRAPATSIALLAELELAGRGTRSREALIDEIGRLARRTLSLADDFVRVAQADQRPLQPVAVDAASLVAEVFADLEPQAAVAGVRLRVDGAAQATLDPALVQRAIGNLVSNAIRHGPPGSEVRVVVTGVAGGEGCRVEVIDQGPGLSAAAMAELNAAQAGLAAGSARGSGFGLLFVQRVAQRHRGRLLVHRGETGGAVFTLELHDLPH